MKIAIYPGSFDPITMGHFDIIVRASKIVDKLYVGVLNNPNKNPLFTVDERKEMIRQTVINMKNIEVASFTGLLVNFAREKDASVIIKGLRAVSDFEYELQMASMNKKLDSDIETLFMMTNNRYSYLSSNVVKDVARFNGCITGLVPQCVEKKLMDKMHSLYM